MPFTPAHPAIILPFIKINSRFVSATGLIVGSVTPDFEYFFKMSVSGQHSHTLAGLFYFDLPVGCFLAIVFHAVVKKRFVSNLPLFLQSRLHPLSTLDFLSYIRKNWIAFLFSLLLGAVSHIFWDAFTHRFGFFATRLSFYDGAYVPFEGVKYPLWYALQHISTAVGLTVVAVYIWLMKRYSVPMYKPSVSYWIFVVALASLVMVVRFGLWPDHAKNIGNLVVSMISALCLAVLIAGLIPSRISNHG